MKRFLIAVTAAATTLAMAVPAQAITDGVPDNKEHPMVGQLLFYVPTEVDSRFTDPGAWFNCTGTLINATTVLTAGHCTEGIGDEGGEPADPLNGGGDVWFSNDEEPDYSMLPPSSTFVPDDATRTATSPGPQRWTTARPGTRPPRRSRTRSSWRRRSSTTTWAS